ncbi:hypothetical protein BC332_06973 [Capsicum chinense]|nr:hypothetical protein BC332_06973 [Capsicum chinense]
MSNLFGAYGFGGKGKPASGDRGAVSPNATLQIDLELVTWNTVSSVIDDKKENESWDMNNQEKIKAAVEKKEEGNALFKVGNYPRASRRYETLLETGSTNVKALYWRAQAYMNMAVLDLAECDIKKALEIDPNNRTPLKRNHNRWA